MIPWEEWSEAALARAAREKKPIALHIGATWCHWCHVMDEGSYTWPGVAERMAERFVCIRVDTDRRPDINERYNQGGWPTLAILDAAGEVLVGRTYVSGIELLSLLRSASDPTSRWTVAPEPKPLLGVSATRPEDIWKKVTDGFDPYHAGFGEMEKFPHTGVLEWLCDRTSRASAANGPSTVDWARNALDRTLTAMASRGMHDHVEGGFFRYATQEDWNEPHTEKLLEDHGRLLAVYARASRSADPGEANARLATISHTIRWLLKTLQDPVTGAFFGSQDADSDYYRLAARAAPPTVDRTIYAGWNGLLIAALVRCGAALGRPGLIGVARVAAEHLLTLVDEDGRVRRHKNGISGLLEDQVQVAEGLRAVGDAFGETSFTSAAITILEWAWTHMHVDGAGGLWDREPEAGDAPAVGRLRHVRRNVVGNAAFSSLATRLAATHGPPWAERAAETARIALEESEDWGFFAAPAGAAAERVLAQPVVIKVATSGWPLPPLLIHGLADPHPDHIWVGVRDAVPAGMAMACSGSACARPTADLATLLQSIAALR